MNAKGIWVHVYDVGNPASLSFDIQSCNGPTPTQITNEYLPKTNRHLGDNAWLV